MSGTQVESTLLNIPPLRQNMKVRQGMVDHEVLNLVHRTCQEFCQFWLVPPREMQRQRRANLRLGTLTGTPLEVIEEAQALRPHGARAWGHQVCGASAAGRVS